MGVQNRNAANQVIEAFITRNTALQLQRARPKALPIRMLDIQQLTNINNSGSARPALV
jgi:hypothetical protein